MPGIIRISFQTRTVHIDKLLTEEPWFSPKALLTYLAILPEGIKENTHQTVYKLINCLDKIFPVH